MSPALPYRLPSEKSTVGYWPSVLSGLLLVLYAVGVFVHGHNAALTFDEAWAWDTAREHSLHDIVWFDAYFRANNHLPISLWFRWLGDLKTPTEWLLRLPSLVACAVLALGVVKIARDTLPPAARPVLLGLVLFLPELFYQGALARGYAFSAAAEVWALWAAIRFALEGRRPFLLLAYGAGAVAALSILSASLFLVALLAWLVFLQAVNPWALPGSRPPLLRRLARGLFWPELLVVFLLLFYLYPVGSSVAASDEAIPGADSFLFGTFASLLTSILGQDFSFTALRILLKLALCGLSGALLLIAAWRLRENSRFLLRPAGTVTALCLLMIVGMYLLRFLHGTPFPLVRAALFFFVPLVVALVVLGTSEFPRRWPTRLTATAVCLLLLFANGSLARLRHALDPGPREMLEAIRDDLRETDHDGDGSGKRFFYERTGPPWDFYATRLGLDRLERTGRWESWPLPRLLDEQFDYLFIESRLALQLIWRGPADVDFRTLMTTADSRYFLLRRIPNPENRELGERRDVQTR